MERGWIRIDYKYYSTIKKEKRNWYAVNNGNKYAEDWEKRKL